MSARLTEIQSRREALVGRAAEQRDALNELIEPWRARLAVADRLIAFARKLHAGWITLAAGALVISQLGKGARGKWIASIWTFWNVYNALRGRGPRSRS
ncbi:MAG TPA: hypothetical protein VFN94_09230 [Nitrospiria bacterium]|nr:hypothetical protein [Nitrospiria bacterium]